MLEPCEAKVSCTVLRGEWGREAPDLPDWLDVINKNGYAEKMNRMNLIKGDDMFLNDLLFSSQYFGKHYTLQIESALARIFDALSIFFPTLQLYH